MKGEGGEASGAQISMHLAVNGGNRAAGVEWGWGAPIHGIPLQMNGSKGWLKVAGTLFGGHWTL